MQRHGIENVLKYGYAQHQVEFSARVELRQVLHLESATMGNAFGSGPALRLRDHGRTQVNAGYISTPRGQQSTPTTHPAPNVQHARTGSYLEPRCERQTLFQMNGAIIEFRHSVGTYRSQSVTLGREALRSVLPI